MRTKSRHNKLNMNRTNRTNSSKKIFWGALAALFLALILFNGPIGHFLSKPVMAVGRPFLTMSDSLKNWWQGNLFLIEKKENLENENKLLRKEIEEMKIKTALLGAEGKDDKKTRSFLPKKSEQKYLSAPILVRPPQSPYDTLLVDAGSKDGVKEGMRATAYGDVFLGYVSEVFGRTSKITLVSFFKKETNIMLASSSISAIAVGRGGGNFEIILPRSLKVLPGEAVLTLGREPMLMGIVEKILANFSDPFQKILFRLPVNIQELKYVILKY